MDNVVTYVYAKFGDDRLWNEKALAGRKSDNNNIIKNKNNVRGHGGPAWTSNHRAKWKWVIFIFSLGLYYFNTRLVVNSCRTRALVHRYRTRERTRDFSGYFPPNLHSIRPSLTCWRPSTGGRLALCIKPRTSSPRSVQSLLDNLLLIKHSVMGKQNVPIRLVLGLFSRTYMCLYECTHAQGETKVYTHQIISYYLFMTRNL